MLGIYCLSVRDDGDIYMIWRLEYWKGILLAALVAGAFATGWWKGGDAVQRKWDADTAREVKAQLVKNQEDAAKLQALEGVRNENLDYVSNLYFGLGKSQRLRLPQAACGGSNTPSTDSPAGEGIVPNGVSGSAAEDAINFYDETYRNAAFRADSIVESCRVLNDFLK